MKIELLIVSLLFLASFHLYSHKSVDDKFTAYKSEWSKNYDNLELEQFRMSIFYENLSLIEAHNLIPDRTYEEGVNQFTDLLQTEFEQIYLGELQSQESDVYESNGSINVDKDWTKEGKVTAIKDQGSCGSCWAFGAVGSLESLNLIYGTKAEILLSEQMLVDCATKYGCQGCNGGLRDKAFQFVIENGLVTGKEYPYVAKDQKCKIEKGPFKISKYGSVKAGACDDLVEVLQKQPPSVGVDASRWSAYKSGIFSNCATNINHGVVLVAVSSTDGFWKIKNSWGPRWGENGFIRIKYPGSTCAVCNRAYWPIF